MKVTRAEILFVIGLVGILVAAIIANAYTNKTQLQLITNFPAPVAGRKLWLKDDVYEYLERSKG